MIANPTVREVVALSSLNTWSDTEIVQKSWKRCQKYGLRPTDAVYDSVMTGRRLNEIIKENETFIQHTVRILEKLAPYIRQSGHIATLVSKDGTIVHTAGDPSFEEQARTVHLQVGTNWQERRKGTNAMGVALVEQKPVRVHGAQHFYVKNRFLTCAASPVFTPRGELAGVINMSGRKERFNPLTLSLVSMVAETLQSRLLLEEAQHEHVLTVRELERTVDFTPFPLVSLDHERRIIRANQAARRLLGQDCIGKEFKEKKGFVVETISDKTRKTWRSVAVYKRERQKKERLYTFQDIAGACPRIQHVKRLAAKAAMTDYPILLLGESGTGKELLAQSIHTASPRADRPFIAVNCGALPDSLLESEWFGYERGAFTGARREGGIGKFEAAHLGTIFLDEVGDLSPRAQVALLRVLQEKVITRVGGVKSRQVDVRVVAATNKDLLREVKKGTFRTDLYYRLKGIQLSLPPLRERSDIIQLAETFLEEMDYPSARLSKEAQEKLVSHSWPGNVRELKSALVQAAFLAEGGDIRPEHLQFEWDHGDDDRTDSVPTLREVEIAAIQRSLKATGWNVSRAAELLQIGRNTLYRKMKGYQIEKL